MNVIGDALGRKGAWTILVKGITCWRKRSRTLRGLPIRPRSRSGSPDGYEVFTERSGLLEEGSRSLLAKFALSAEHVSRPANSLSPGERSRATLALLAAREANCLVLDEPTNHLDLEAIEQLESALAEFGGTVVLVTHDRRLIEAFEPTYRLVLPGTTSDFAV